MGKIWCDLQALLFQKRQPRRLHQILSSDFVKNACAKSGVICAPCFFRKPSLAWPGILGECGLYVSVSIVANHAWPQQVQSFFTGKLHLPGECNAAYICV